MGEDPEDADIPHLYILIGEDLKDIPNKFIVIGENLEIILSIYMFRGEDSQIIPGMYSLEGKESQIHTRHIHSHVSQAIPGIDKHSKNI